MSTIRHISALGGLALLLAAGAARAETDKRVVLASHRAVYDLTLAQTRGKQSLQSVRGRILYDFSGNACEGYALQFRQVTQLDSGEGKSAVSDLRTTNWENGEGTGFRFESENFLNSKPTEAASGRAQREGGNATITLTKPSAKTFQAPNVVFPSDQMRQVISAAREGKSLLELAVYDGSDNGEKIYNTLAVIGHAIKPGESPPADAAAGQESLASLTRWPVTISYFDRAKSGADQTPLYSIAFDVYENGIARALKLDYGDFVLTGAMTSLELKDAPSCQ